MDTLKLVDFCEDREIVDLIMVKFVEPVYSQQQELTHYQVSKILGHS